MEKKIRQKREIRAKVLTKSALATLSKGKAQCRQELAELVVMKFYVDYRAITRLAVVQ